MVVREREGPPQDLPDTPLAHLPARRSTGLLREPIERDCKEGALFSALKRSEMSEVHDFPVESVR